jgi:hypothetical protein
MPSLASCKRLSRSIADSSNDTNDYCGDEKLLSSLRNNYLSLSSDDKKKFRIYIRLLAIGNMNRLNLVVGGVTGYAAAEILPEAIGATIPGGILGKAITGLTVGFFASKISREVCYTKKNDREEAHKCMPYLNILIKLPVEMINETDSRLIRNAYETAAARIASEKAEREDLSTEKTDLGAHSIKSSLRQRHT